MNRIKDQFENELKKDGLFDSVKNLNRYVGDIHNHCGISYGYGTIEHAIAFAKTQLDFFSVTGHFAWPDIASNPDMCIPEDVIKYHKEGFKKLRREWPHYKKCMKEAESDSTVPFLSYEFHSFYYGDYTIVTKSLDEELPDEVKDGEEDLRLRNLLSANKEQRKRLLPIPHHIGYKKGYRGINYDEFNPEVSPLIEMVSMHGCAESPNARLNYMHTMGPRSNSNTYQAGLKRHLHFGITGSTDHHNAAPGSYGFGRTLLWAESLNRDSIWSALNSRYTAAASGDPIDALLFVNGKRMGEKTKKSGKLEIKAYVSSYDKLDKVEVIQGDQCIAGVYEFTPSSTSYNGSLSMMFGWGKKHKEAIWDVEVIINYGCIKYLTPRFRGIDMVDPLDVPKNPEKNLPSINYDKNRISMHIVSDGNINAVTNATQGFAFDLDGNKETEIIVKVNVKWADQEIVKEYKYSIDELRNNNDSEYVNGFVSPSFVIGPFRTKSETTCYISKTITTDSTDGIYLRAYEENGDEVFTSPISFE